MRKIERWDLVSRECAGERQVAPPPAGGEVPGMTRAGGGAR